MALIAPAASITLPQPVSCFAAAPNSPLVVAGLSNGTVALWNGRDSSVTATLAPHKARVIGVGVTADGRNVYSVAADGTLVRTRLETGAAEPAIRLDLGAAPYGAAVFTADGNTLLVAGEFGDIRMFATASGGLQRELKGHRSEMMRLALRPGSNVLASAGADADIRTWDIISGKQIALIDNPLTSFAVAYHPTDGTLASGGTDRKLTLRDSKGMKPTVAFELPAPKIVAALDWSPDGRHIAMADIDDETLRKGGLQVIVAGTRTAAALDTGGVPPREIAFMADGRLVAVIGRDLRSWNVANVR